jgi:hypothetical protein
MGRLFFVTPTKDLPFEENDFNREIIHPGENEDFSDGCVGIRVDDNFWVVAVLPYSYKDRTIQEIVQEFWPDAKNSTFKPDSDDPYWEQLSKAFAEEWKDAT